MKITIQGEGAEDFADALAQHLTIAQGKIKEIIIAGKPFEFETEPGAAGTACRSAVPVTIEVVA